MASGKIDMSKILFSRGDVARSSVRHRSLPSANAPLRGVSSFQAWRNRNGQDQGACLN
jgi:hypothetical protein